MCVDPAQTLQNTTSDLALLITEACLPEHFLTSFLQSTVCYIGLDKSGYQVDSVLISP